jgi:hypothetical protein
MSTYLSASSALEEFFWHLLAQSGNGMLAVADYLGVHPMHLGLEIFFGLVLIYFVFQKSYKLPKHEPERLTDRVRTLCCDLVLSEAYSNQFAPPPTISRHKGNRSTGG